MWGLGGKIDIMERNMETTIIYRGYIRIREKNMETTIIYRGHIQIMEKKMETTIGFMVWGLGFAAVLGWA